MKMRKVRKGRGLWCRTLLVAALLSFMAVLARPSFAQCEAEGALDSAGDTAIIPVQDQFTVSMVLNMIGTPGSGWISLLDELRARLGLMQRDSVMATLNQFWTHWGGAWKDMTAQLSSGINFQTLQWGRYNDTTNTLSTGLLIEKQRLKSKLQYQPTDAACRFDTLATYMTPSRETSRALENGYEWDLMKWGNNEVGSYAEFGPGNLENWMWKVYVKYFCDYRAEGGHGNAGCTADIDTKNLDVVPSKMLFSRDTVDLTKYSTRMAMLHMIYNISAYKVPMPMLKGSMNSPQGMAKTLDRREYLAKMNAVNALLYNVIADRAPGPRAPLVKDLRESMGADATSIHPSGHEVRQAFIEQLWSPAYYADLYDNPSTVAQKEVYLRAYNLMMLYDMINKQERISNVYAIQTSNILEQADATRGSVNSGAAVKTGGP